MDALKPCPFCGRGQVSPSYCTNVENVISGRFVECEDCAANGPIRSSEAEATAAWNHRPETERLVEALEAMLGMHGSDIEETAARNKARAALTAAKGTDT